jgi:hypothetical protein
MNNKEKYFLVKQAWDGRIPKDLKVKKDGDGDGKINDGTKHEVKVKSNA